MTFQDLRLGVEGLRFRVWSLGLRVEGFRIEGLKFRVEGPGLSWGFKGQVKFRVQGLDLSLEVRGLGQVEGLGAWFKFRVYGPGFRV